MTRPSDDRTLVIVAGPNGSGKTTFYERYLRRAFPVFVNADRIAELLTDSDPAARNRIAADRAEAERRELILRGESFAMETVFSRPQHWLGFIEFARANGFLVRVFFLCLETPELNMTRVLLPHVQRRASGAA